MDGQNTYYSDHIKESLIDISKDGFGSELTHTFDKNPTRILRHNPFSTRFTTPGTIPYYFPEEFCHQIKKECVNFKNYLFQSMVGADHLKMNICLLHLADRLKSNHCYGQIVGPHGSGKSTFIAALALVLKQQNMHLVQEVLHDKQRILPESFWKSLSQKPENPEKKIIAVIDGYEQLSWLQRFKLRCVCHQKHAGLILTSHKRIFSFPLLYTTRSSQEILEQIVDYLLELPCDFIREKTLSILMQKHKNNIRDVLFALYDLYEDQTAPLIERG